MPKPSRSLLFETADVKMIQIGKNFGGMFMKNRFIAKIISSLLALSFAVTAASCSAVDTDKTEETSAETTTSEATAASESSETSESTAETSKESSEIPEGFFPEEPYDADKVHPIREPGAVTGKDAVSELNEVELEYIKYRMDGEYMGERMNFKHPEKFGVTAGEPTLGKVGPQDYESAVKTMDGLLDRLYKLDYESFVKQDRDLYEQMVFDIEEERYMTQYPGYKYLVPAISDSDLGCFYATVGNIDIDTEQQAEEFIELLKDTDRYFDDVCGFEEERSRLGFASIEQYYQQAFQLFYLLQQDSNIKPFRAMVEENIGDVEGMSDAGKKMIMEEFDKVMAEVVIPEFEECGKRFLAIKDTAVNETGLAGFPHGKELYEHMFRKAVGRDCNIDEITSGIEEILKTGYVDLGTAKIPGGSNQDLLDYMEDAADEYFPDLKISYRIYKLPQLFKVVGIGGVYYGVNLDDNTCERIYLPDEVSQKQVIFHEGVPGHMYQFSYHKTHLEHIYPVLFENNFYGEGWATYIMCNPAPMYGLDTDQDLVYSEGLYLQRMALARADICLNYEGLSVKEAEEYLGELLGGRPSGLEGMITDPGLNSWYGVGLYETLKTLEAIRALEPDMSLKKMHTLYLDAGPGCFDRILASAKREVEGQ